MITAARFATTPWAMILRERAHPSRRVDVLAELFRAYRKPLYVYARHRGLTRSDADDAVSGLFVQLLRRGLVEKLEPTRGRLRDYLRRCMRHYLADQRAAKSAQKRGGLMTFRPLDAVPDELLTSENSPERAFEQAWAQQVLERAYDRLHAEFERGERTGSFEMFHQYARVEASTSELARRHGMTISGAKSFLHRTRRRFREILVEQVGATVSDLADTAGELSYLMSCLST